MLEIHLTLPVVVNMLRTIAEREPDRLGREDDGAGCVYATVKNDVLVPICIVGQMFADLGILRLLLTNPNVLKDEWGTPANLGACSVGFGFWDTMREAWGITADTDAQEFMRDVQRRQDEGMVWGVAFSLTVTEHKERLVDDLDAEERALERKRQAVTDLFG